MPVLSLVCACVIVGNCLVDVIVLDLVRSFIESCV